MRRVFRIPFGRRRVERDIDDELRFHIETRTERLIAAGLTPDAARADTAETRRADLAAEWLESHCSSPGVAVAVTHGGFRRLLSHQLVRRGWIRRGLWHRYHNWSAWILDSPQPRARSGS